jgi:hypothetical protein
MRQKMLRIAHRGEEVRDPSHGQTHQPQGKSFTLLQLASSGFISLLQTDLDDPGCSLVRLVSAPRRPS